MSSKSKTRKKQEQEEAREERLTELTNFFQNTALSIPYSEATEEEKEAAVVVNENETERTKFIIGEEFGKFLQRFFCLRK